MIIRDVSTYALRATLDRRFAYSQKWVSHRTALLVKVTTDEDVIGWGEVFCHDAGAAVAAMIEKTYKPLILGKYALAPGPLWETLYNWTKDYGQKGVSVAALSGIDIALWDIMGKVAGLPVHTLLGGGCREKIRGYATGMYMREGPDSATRLAEEAASYVEQGFTAVKMKVGFGVDRDVDNVRSVRDAIGDATDLMVDANHAYDRATAIRLGKRLEDYGIAWFEEPVSPEDIEGYRSVRDALTIPIAGGEAEFTRYGFRPLITGGAVDIVQPDVCLTGGLSEARQIATLARTWHVRCTPHVWGTAVALHAALHFIATLPDTPPSLYSQQPVIELDRTEHPLREAVVVNPATVIDGYIAVPQTPGLGVEVDQAVIEEYRVS